MPLACDRYAKLLRQVAQLRRDPAGSGAPIGTGLARELEASHYALLSFTLLQQPQTLVDMPLLADCIAELLAATPPPVEWCRHAAEESARLVALATAPHKDDAQLHALEVAAALLRGDAAARPRREGSAE